MIDREQASAIAGEHVAKLSLNFHQDDQLVIVHEATIEKLYEWIFFYTSKRWLETSETRFAVAGNAPFLVSRDTGQVHVFGTANSIDRYIEEYEQALLQNQILNRKDAKAQR